MNIIRLTRHRTDPDVLVLNTPPNISSQMGKFEPARYDADSRAYLIHANTLDALRRFTSYIGAHIVDDRPAEGTGRKAEECGNCGQPGSAHDRTDPKFCPDCGQEWRPITYEEASPTATYGTCGACGRQQGGRFAHCVHCGSQDIRYPDRQRFDLRLPRNKLADPMPIAETLPAAIDEIEANQRQQESA